MTVSGRLQMRILAATVSVVFALACFAPKAKPIEGDIASAIQEGMAQGQSSFDHHLWDEILRSYAKEGGRGFDYAGLKREESKLTEYLLSLAKVDLSSLPTKELLALFANAYNAYTVKTVLDHVSRDGTYEIESIRDLPDVFKREEHLIGGYRLSLNNIEHNILRPLFKDPRIHFAVNCASKSCPPIPPRAFNANAIDRELEEVTRNVLTSPDYVRVEGDALLVTKIMEWYGADFVTEGYRGAEKDLPSFIRKYAREDVRRWIDARPSPAKVEFMHYDWSLNRSH